MKSINKTNNYRLHQIIEDKNDPDIFQPGTLMLSCFI